MKTQDDMSVLFDNLIDLNEHQRTSIKHRYRFLMDEYRQRACMYSYLFYMMRTTMTVGSLAVPALLSLQTNNNPSIYWFTWGLSLAVTTANGITTLFKLESKFLTLHTTMEHIRTETWQFLELAGHYSGHHGHVTPTHRNQFVFYCSRIEKIRMKHIGDEYVKHIDTETQAHPPAPTGFVVPSPAEQALSKTPRRDSIHTTGDDSVIEIEEKKTELAVPVQGQGRTLPDVGTPRIVVLPQT